MNLPVNVVEMVNSFAKEHKFSRQKLITLVSKTYELAPKRAAGAGRKLSSESEKVRNFISSLQGSGRVCTAKQIAEEITVNPIVVNNTIKWALSNNQNIVASGKTEKVEGKRGKPATVWQFN